MSKPTESFHDVVRDLLVSSTAMPDSSRSMREYEFLIANEMCAEYERRYGKEAIKELLIETDNIIFDIRDDIPPRWIFDEENHWPSWEDYRKQEIISELVGIGE